MPSLHTAAHRATRSACRTAPGVHVTLALVAAALAGSACDIDDRTFASSELTFSRRTLESGDAGTTDGGATAVDAGSARDAAPSPEPAPDEDRPVRALGDAVPTDPLGGFTGKEESARCVEGVVIGFDYRFNDSTADAFPDRFTFVVPVCAVPDISGDALVPNEPAQRVWSAVGGDATEVVRPVTTQRVLCPRGYAVIGLIGSMDEVVPSPQTFAVRELAIACAPLLVDADRVDILRGPIASVTAEPASAVPGALPVEVACGDGTNVATGATVRWGSWLDGVELQCSRLAWPFTNGHGCALDDDCQSGTCDVWATCAP